MLLRGPHPCGRPAFGEVAGGSVAANALDQLSAHLARQLEATERARRSRADHEGVVRHRDGADRLDGSAVRLPGAREHVPERVRRGDADLVRTLSVGENGRDRRDVARTTGEAERAEYETPQDAEGEMTTVESEEAL